MNFFKKFISSYIMLYYQKHFWEYFCLKWYTQEEIHNKNSFSSLEVSSQHFLILLYMEVESKDAHHFRAVKLGNPLFRINYFVYIIFYKLSSQKLL